MAVADQDAAAHGGGDQHAHVGADRDPGSGGGSRADRSGTGHDGDRQDRPLRIAWSRAATIALGVAGGLLLADLTGATVARLRGLLVLLLVSLFLSFGMEPAVQWLHQRGVRRGPGTALVFVAAGLMTATLGIALATLVGGQLRTLVSSGPQLLDTIALRASTLPEPFGQQAAELLRGGADALPAGVGDLAAMLGRGAVGVGTTVLGGVLDLLTVALVTFYLVADGPRLRRTLSGRLGPSRQRELLQVWELAIAKTGGYVYSRVLTAAVSSVVHVVAFTLLDLPYAVALGLWVGVVSSLVPVVGTYIAGALPLVVALATDPTAALWVGGVLVTYQQVENYLVVPRITEATLALHPAVAFLSVLAGAALLGAAGALLALPVSAIIAALVSTYGERHEVLEHGLTSQAPPPRREDVPWLTARQRGVGPAGTGGADEAGGRPGDPT